MSVLDRAVHWIRVRRKSLLSMAEDELLEAEVDLMRAQTGKEFAQSVVDYQTARRDRLRQRVRELKAEKEVSK